jgi:hypothetical protein
MKPILEDRDNTLLSTGLLSPAYAVLRPCFFTSSNSEACSTSYWPLHFHHCRGLSFCVLWVRAVQSVPVIFHNLSIQPEPRISEI